MPQLTVAWLAGDDAFATAVRTAVVYAFALAAVRIGSKRFLSEATAFDVIVAIMLGSIMSRGISGSALVPTLLSGAVDLEQAIRLQAGQTELSRVRLAYLERNGSISVIAAEREPVVLDIRVEEGVQTVRVRLE